MSKESRIRINKTYLILLALSLLFILAGTLYLNARWLEYRSNAEHQAILQASSIAATLNGERLVDLFEQEPFPDTREFDRFRLRMLRAAAMNPQFIALALYAVRPEGVSILIDTLQGENSFALHYQGDESMFSQALETNSTLLSPSFKDEGPGYRLILTPLTDLESREVFGGLAFVITTEELYSSAVVDTVRQFFILLISWLFMLCASFLFVLYQRSLAMRSELEGANQQLMETDSQMQLLVDQMPQALALHEILCNEQGNCIDYRFLKVNPMFTNLTGLTESQLLGKTVLEVLPHTESFWIDEYAEVALSGKVKNIEHYSMHFDKWFLVRVYSPKKGQFITIFEDITQQRARQKEVEFLNYHDPYTRMFNRNAFTLHFSEYDGRHMYPLAILLFDINGLKVVNDTYGHEIGDLLIWQLAESINEACTDGSWISARLGGDEFGILVPYAKRAAIELLLDQIQTNYRSKNIGNQGCSISSGYAMKEEQGIGFEAVLKRAEDDLFEHKLAEHATSRQQTIDVLLESLFSKCPREKAHSSRVSEISKLIAKELGLSQDSVEMIGVAGIMHDIGKIAIDDSVLNKPDKLDEYEWAQMRRHPEIGFHLLSSVTRYSDFAKEVLAHHERWDGNGYPRRLKQEQIPLGSRIIAVADSYDAMTYKRPYRDPMTHQQACEELRRCSASQFDPKVVEAFLACSELLS